MFSDPINAQQRLQLIEGFSRDSNMKGQIPDCINNLCLGYKSNAIEWIIKGKDLKSLLSVNKHKIHHKYLEIGTFVFSLSLENNNNHIIFSINPLKTESQCSHRIYCELYCIETQTQFKRTHLFKFRKRITTLKHQSNGTIILRKAGKFESCAWPESLLNISQCENKLKLTFSAHINILDESQRNPVPKSPSSNIPYCIEYRWDLNRYYDILHNTSSSNRECKIYSPNFMDDCWCLWFQKSEKSRDENQDSYTFGLQLLKLPSNYRQGILFDGRFTYGSDLHLRSESDRDQNQECEHDRDPIEFAYYVDYRHQDMKIKNIKNVSWVKIEITLQ